jgi:preprotein translocase subunit SecF
MAKRTDDADVTEADESGAVEAPGIESTAALPHHSFFTRLYTGTGAFNVIGRRKVWFTISGLIITISIASILIRGFTFGIDFGAAPRCRCPSQVRTAQRRCNRSEVFPRREGSPVGPDRRRGQFGDGADSLGDAVERRSRQGPHRPVRRSSRRARRTTQQAGDQRFRGVGGWGEQITHKGLIALVVFVVLAAIYIAVRYEPYMAVRWPRCSTPSSAAGIYSLVGWEVTRAP